jgi:hypothetical protein
MTPGRDRPSVLLRWYLLRVAVAAIITLILLPVPSDAFVMQESGHFSGTGYHELSASGPMCSIVIQPANESLLEAGNGTVWLVQLNGSLKEVV